MRKIVTILIAFFCISTLAEAQFSGGGGGTTESGPAVPRKLTTVELQKQCDNGDAISCDNLGVRYLQGDGVAKDAQKANALFQRACDGGDYMGCFDIAESYRFGEGVGKDTKSAAAYYQRGCDAKGANSCAQLAILYNDGDGVPQDDGKAALFAKRSCDGKSSLGCTLLATVYTQGAPGYPKDLARAEELFAEACFANVDFNRPPDSVSQAACSSLAKLTGKPACKVSKYTDSAGKAGTICFDEQAGWQVSNATIAEPVSAGPVMPKADVAGAANAALSAGNHAYARRDFATAAVQFATACDGGSDLACGSLGGMYLNGEGVSASGARAATLLAKACDAGITSSCGKLGLIYDSGNGVTTNKRLAFMLFSGACARSDMAACYNQGRLFESGQGGTFDLAQAAILYGRACASGVADSCVSIGAMHASGIHFAQNDAQAVTYFDLGCTQGSQSGCARSKETNAAMARSSELAAAKAAVTMPARSKGSLNCQKARTIPESDLAEIERLARIGFASNDPICVHVLGWLSEEKRDYELAYVYYSNAANKNFGMSVNNIGGLYSRGNFVQQSRLTGNEWYRRALQIAEADGDTALAALARQNIAINEEAMRPPPPAPKGCQKQSVFVDGFGDPICLD
jgi:uncharacterized protein